MNAENTSISVTTGDRKEELLWESVPLITCSLSLPHVSGNGPGPRRIDRYYRRVERILLARLKELHPKFCALADQALAASQPAPFCHVWTDWELGCLDERFLSIGWNLHSETGVSHHCDLWELPWGAPASVKMLLPKKLHRTADEAPCLLREDGVYLVNASSERLLFRFSNADEQIPHP